MMINNFPMMQPYKCTHDIDLIFLDYVFMQFLPSLVASAAVYSARLCLQLAPAWPSKMISITKYTSDDLLKCKDMMMRFVIRYLLS